MRGKKYKYNLLTVTVRQRVIVQRVGNVCRRDAVSGKSCCRSDHSVSSGQPLMMSETGFWPVTTSTDASVQSLCCRCCWWWWCQLFLLATSVLKPDADAGLVQMPIGRIDSSQLISQLIELSRRRCLFYSSNNTIVDWAFAALRYQHSVMRFLAQTLYYVHQMAQKALAPAHSYYQLLVA